MSIISDKSEITGIKWQVISKSKEHKEVRDTKIQDALLSLTRADEYANDGSKVESRVELARSIHKATNYLKGRNWADDSKDYIAAVELVLGISEYVILANRIGDGNVTISFTSISKDSSKAEGTMLQFVEQGLIAVKEMLARFGELGKAEQNIQKAVTKLDEKLADRLKASAKNDVPGESAATATSAPSAAATPAPKVEELKK